MHTDAESKDSWRVLIVGAGGHGKVVADALECSGCKWPLYFSDDSEELWGRPLMGSYVLGSLKTVLQNDDQVHVAIGNNVIRQRVCDSLSSARLLTVQHPGALVSAYAIVEGGCFIAAGAVVGPFVTLGKGVIVNHGAVVDHDCQIGDFCHIAPLASLAGDVCLDSGVFIGAGARVLPGVKVGADAVIGAGAVVLQDVAAGATVVGVPATTMALRHSKR